MLINSLLDGLSVFFRKSRWINITKLFYAFSFFLNVIHVNTVSDPHMVTGSFEYLIRTYLAFNLGLLPRILFFLRLWLYNSREHKRFLLNLFWTRLRLELLINWELPVQTVLHVLWKICKALPVGFDKRIKPTVHELSI